jgi:arylsulfatase A-like enzyme
VGKLRRHLQQLKLDENTIFVFTSDNGGLSGLVGPKGWRRGTTDNSPLRWGKGSAYEGGVRVPLIVAWPGTIAAGGECDVPVISYDHLPTLMEATQTPLKEQQVVDGESLMPLLTDKGQLKREAIFWHYPHYHTGTATPYSALREGDWKLIEFYEDERVELYNLRRDAGEMQNVAEVETDVSERLKTRLRAWRQEVGAQEPTGNDAYDPEKAWGPERKGKKKK